MKNKNYNITILDILDGVLDKGIVIAGDLIISIANIDLVYVNLRLFVTAVESVMKVRGNSNGCESWVSGTNQHESE
ncbi:gas vesicle protein [Bacillus sp. JJ664]